MLYAIKVVRKDVLLEYDQVEGTLLEKSIMLKCRHQFLVTMEHLLVSDHRLFFVMPFISGGELYKLFSIHRRFLETHVKFYAV